MVSLSALSREGVHIINSQELHIISAEGAVYHQTEANSFIHGRRS